jgi:hypothetical protein
MWGWTALARNRQGGVPLASCGPRQRTAGQLLGTRPLLHGRAPTYGTEGQHPAEPQLLTAQQHCRAC